MTDAFRSLSPNESTITKANKKWFIEFDINNKIWMTIWLTHMHQAIIKKLLLFIVVSWEERYAEVFIAYARESIKWQFETMDIRRCWNSRISGSLSRICKITVHWKPIKLRILSWKHMSQFQVWKNSLTPMSIVNASDRTECISVPMPHTQSV